MIPSAGDPGWLVLRGVCGVLLATIGVVLLVPGPVWVVVPGALLGLVLAAVLGLVVPLVRAWRALDTLYTVALVAQQSGSESVSPSLVQQMVETASPRLGRRLRRAVGRGARS